MNLNQTQTWIEFRSQMMMLKEIVTINKFFFVLNSNLIIFSLSMVAVLAANMIYDRHFDASIRENMIDRKKIRLRYELASGQFGEVYKGTKFAIIKS